MTHTTALQPTSPPAGDEEGERVLLALAGEPERYCMHCGKLLTGENDGWAHPRCEEVVEAADKADEVHDNGDLDKVERKLRRKGKCPWQIRAPGWDGGGIYCGREITEHGDYPSLFCLEHECEDSGDDEGALQERNERTEELLAAATYNEPSMTARPVSRDRRYDNYTHWIENPGPESPESTEQVERGSRVLHWEGMENGPDPLRAWDAIRWNVSDAQHRTQEV